MNERQTSSARGIVSSRTELRVPSNCKSLLMLAARSHVLATKRLLGSHRRDNLRDNQRLAIRIARSKGLIRVAVPTR